MGRRPERAFPFVTPAGELITYTLYPTAGLTQVLDDGSNTYLYGLGRIGEEQPGGWVLHLPDGLGSVRQLVGEDGAVTLAQSFKPYGGLLDRAGDGTSVYAFAGEWRDGTGLVHLRARYLDSGTGRFLTRDPWGGSVMRPGTFNGFIYVEANPVNRTDPTGQHWDPWGTAGGNPRDLTDWLHREMISNVNDPIINSLRFKNRIDKGMMGGGAITAIAGCATGNRAIMLTGGFMFVGGGLIHADALLQFRDQVKNGARWDFKDEIGIQLGPGITFCTGGTCINDIEYSVPGNIFFAYIGRAAGFLGVELQAGAGWAEITDPAHDPASEEYAGPYQGAVDIGPTPWILSTWNWGDEPIDHEAVTLGIQLWNKYQGQMTRGQFESELANCIGRLAHYPPISDAVKEDIARKWPYQVGHFDNKGSVYVLLGDQQ